MWLVELAPLTDPTQVDVALAKVLRVRDVSGEGRADRLIEALADKQVLLVLDNCEHLIEACAECVDSILRRTDCVRILATSREALAVQGERAWRIQPLGTVEPLHLPSLEQLEQVESIRLFIDRARVRMPELALSAENAAALAQISRRLEGIPLAIELAAARVRDLSIEEICSRIGGDSMQLLTGGARTSLARQRTMQATLDWSHSLLAESERMLLRRLSVFARGFTLEAAEAIADCAPPRPKWILNGLLRLVDQSMVVVLETAGCARFRLLEPVRQYSCERLLSSGEEKLVRDRHRDYFVALAGSLVRDLKTVNPAPGLFPRFLAEQEEFELVLSRSFEHDPEIGLQLVASLAPIWGELELAGHGHWLEDFLARTTGTVDARIRVLSYAGVFALRRFDAVLAKSRFQESATLARDSHNRDELVPTLIFLAGVSDGAEAQAALDEAWDVARASGDPHLRMYCLLQAVEALPPNEFAKRRPLLEDSAALARSAGDVGALVWALNALMSGWVHVEQRLDLGRCALEELLRIGRFFGNPRWTAYALMEFGMLAELEGNFRQAAQLMMEGESINGEIDPDNTKERIALGRVFCKLGNVDRGLSMIREGLRRSLRRNTQFDIHHGSLALSSLGVVAGMAGQHARAARLFGAVDAVIQAHFPGAPSAEHWKICAEPLVEIKSALGESAYDALRAEGLAMTLDQAAALALQDEHQLAGAEVPHR